MNDPDTDSDDDTARTPGAATASSDRPRVHALGADEVLDSLGTGAGGLDSAEATERLGRHGPNRLPEGDPDPLWKRLARHFDDVLIYILLAAAVLKAVLGEWVDFGVILAVAVANAVIGFVQEGRAERTLAGLRSMMSLSARVRRNGSWVEIDAADLVPGDIVRIRSGDRIPADLRLIEVTELRAEESGLTGESEPVDKQIAPVEPDAGIGDRFSMAYSGSLVSSGRGIGVVTATGSDTEIGRINAMIGEVPELTTPLERQIRRFSSILSKGILAIAVLMLVVGWGVHDMAVGVLLTAAVAFAVAAIPEGLPAVVTITLARGVQRMARRNAITRNLTSVETLGSVTVICSDKTGTLTRNEMTVQKIVTPVRSYTVEGVGYEPIGAVHDGDRGATLDTDADLAALVQVNALANDASLRKDDGQWQLLGEPTEGALRTLAEKLGFDDGGATRRAVVPFESEHKLMATLDELADGTRRIHVKGAPDRILDRCGAERAEDGSHRPLDRAFWEARIDELGGEGLRVLAAAERRADDDTGSLRLSDLDGDLVMVGLVGILDPPRPEATQAVAEARQAGIRVKMITGDHAGTATAIGRQMGIIDPSDGAGHETVAITGAELDRVDDDELRDIADRYDTFARVSPEHKLRLVRALQANGEVVAMTGDGVNDAPALRQAEVGVAMGIKGTEATKEAAEIVLADDNFATIERAIEEGRRTFDNIQKSIVFLLPTNGAQSLVLLTAVLLGLPLPLEPVQILWVNLIAAVTLSLALAFEPAEPDVMRRPPRRPGAPIIRRSMAVKILIASLVIGGATLASYFIARANDLEQAHRQTLAVTMLAMAQVGYLFSCRNLRDTSLRISGLFTNRVVWLSVAALIVLQAMFVHLPLMHTLFGSAPLTAANWAVTVAAAVGIFLLMELIKATLRTRRPTTG